MPTARQGYLQGEGGLAGVMGQAAAAEGNFSKNEGPALPGRVSVNLALTRHIQLEILDIWPFWVWQRVPSRGGQP